MFLFYHDYMAGGPPKLPKSSYHKLKRPAKQQSGSITGAEFPMGGDCVRAVRSIIWGLN